jgi:AbrB family looped-hinge helix DNA binding protein
MLGEFMVQREKADVTVVSGKGQVVIPQNIRKKLGIGPKTKLLVYGYEDAVIMKKLNVPDVTKELKAMYRRVDKRIAEHGELTNDEINQAIAECRRKKDDFDK